MSDLTVLEMMDIRTVLSAAQIQFEERHQEWVDLGLNTKSNDTIWPEYIEKCKFLRQRLLEEIKEELRVDGVS